MVKKIITVNGPIDPEDMGMTLPHEHIMVDFIGVDSTGARRYRQDEVVDRVAPYLLELKAAGVRTFIDCTPMYIGRDVSILKGISKITGLHILTNSGLYMGPYIPEETFSVEPKVLAQQWINEHEQGIDGTDIKPGFIKTAVHAGRLIKVEQKIITAAALTSIHTGLTITTHTEDAVAAMEILDILEKLNVNPDKWIFVHAQEEMNYDLLLEVAKRGAWIELDRIGIGAESEYLYLLLKLLDAGYENKILLSQDSVGYWVGQGLVRSIKPFSFLTSKFIPFLKENGFSEKSICNLTVTNPSVAFSF